MCLIVDILDEVETAKAVIRMTYPPFKPFLSVE